jgi:cAMP-dependent protein kinase regulator
MAGLYREAVNRYLEEKGVKILLHRILVSILQARPDSPEDHIIQMLTKPKPPSTPAKPIDTSRDSDLFPPASVSRAEGHHAMPPAGLAPVQGRRASYVSPAVLSASGSLARRKGMSSRMTSDTTVEIRHHPKDPATFARLADIVKSIDIFSFLQPENRAQLVAAMVPMEFTDGQTIIKEGDAPDNFYILESGECKVMKRFGDEEDQVAALSPGQYFGELALISGRARTASVIAIGAVKCWAIDQTTYLGMLKGHHVQKRQHYQSLLRRVPALRVLPDYEILLVADALQPFDPAEGEEIVKQGDAGNWFFIILSGRCRVLKRAPDEDEPHVIAVLESGEYFGEVALMKETPRAATVIAGPGCK